MAGEKASVFNVVTKTIAAISASDFIPVVFRFYENRHTCLRKIGYCAMCSMLFTEGSKMRTFPPMTDTPESKDRL
jgi:hypothetical protein